MRQNATERERCSMTVRENNFDHIEQRKFRLSCMADNENSDAKDAK